MPTPLALLPREPVQCGLEAKVLAASQERIQRRLLQRRTYRGPHLRPLVHDVVAGHGGRATRGRKERRQHQNGRRLPRPVRPQEAVDLAWLDAQVYAVDSPRALFELPDEVFDLYTPFPAH